MIDGVKSMEEVFLLAFGDNGPRKKTAFQKLTILIVVLMLFITVAGILVSALGSLGW